MREIKFRVWYKGINREGQMIYNWTGCESSSIDYQLFPSDYQLNDSFKRPRGLEKKVVWAIMQYTGLKDKTGKEIYEGDIVKAIDTSLKSNIQAVDEELFAACILYKLRPERQNTVLKIIGNIYENPEVLNG